jgi:hypothetical protein
LTNAVEGSIPAAARIPGDRDDKRARIEMPLVSAFRGPSGVLRVIRARIFETFAIHRSRGGGRVGGIGVQFVDQFSEHGADIADSVSER